MALVNLSYCNAAAGAQAAVQYDDVAHTIVNGMTVGPCADPSGLPSGIEIYSHTDGSTIYKVFTQNSPPYAYVSSFAEAYEFVAVVSQEVMDEIQHHPYGYIEFAEDGKNWMRGYVLEITQEPDSEQTKFKLLKANI